MEENILATESVGKLVRKFALPCVISMVVAALYNIVDQIYIGWSEAGAYGNAATNLVYPFTVFALGLALLVGDGASSYFSLLLGTGDREKASRSVGNGIVMLILLTLNVKEFGLVLQTQILSLFGADPKEELCYGYAVDYYHVICLGMPFYMIGQGLNGSIRADGSPRYAMACTLSGAVANLILDPLFIFTFHQGVKGAAIATVLGQMLTFALSLVYLFRPKNLLFGKKTILLGGEYIGKISSIGLASLIIQLSIVVIMTVENNLIGSYGYETVASTGEPFGSVIPLAVLGIVTKIFGIVVSVAIGIGLGGQPIIGFNRGAGNLNRVKECIGVLTKAVLIVGAVAFVLFEAAPDLFIAVFGKSQSTEYTEFSRLCIRIFLGGIVLTCYIKAVSIILQAMGNSVGSTLVALTRDVLAFVPATVLLALLTHNIVTMLWAAVIADVIGATVAFFSVRGELKKLSRKAEKLPE